MANEFIARNGIIAKSNSTITGSLNVTAGITGSLFGTASYSTTNLSSSYASNSTSASYSDTSTSASYSNNSTSASFSQTAASVNTLVQNVNVQGNLTVVGTLTAQQYVVSSSVYYVTESFASGSHIFGNTLDDTHQFTGSVLITGSLTSPSITGSLFGTSSTAVSSSFAVSSSRAVSSSFALSASYALFTPSVQTISSSATVTPTNTNDLVVITAQTGSLTIANPTGSMLQGQALMIRIKDNGTARSIDRKSVV